MDKVVYVKLDGDFNQGFRVTLDVAEEGRFPYIIGVSGSLPSASEVPESYRNWQTKYCSLESGYRRKRQQRISFMEENVPQSEQVNSIQDCYQAAEKLKVTFQDWLNCNEFRPVESELFTALNKSDKLRVVLQTENEQLRKLPWEEWSFFQRFPHAVFGISSLSSKSQKQRTTSRKVRILAILGNSDGINLQEDRKALEQLPSADVCLLVEPIREQFQRLWSESWDILFFAGHSSSKDGEHGYLYINRTDADKLEISELKEGLRVAIGNGLKLAIFNSCDGLGLARQLERLQIPQVIVMREPVPDEFAQEFLRYFLTNFSGGMSLYAAVRCAREMLRELSQIESDFPGASWLPVICQSPTAVEAFIWPSSQSKLSRQRLMKIAVISVLAVGAIAVATVGSLLGPRRQAQQLSITSQLPCPITEKRELSACIKDLRKTPLVIGFLTSPYQELDPSYDYEYLPLKNYLKQKLGNRVKDIRIEVGDRISSQQAQDKIANKEWDIVFAHSPMNSVVAKNNGYTWLGSHSPYTSNYYNSVLFVRADSPIKSIADIEPTTMLALGYVGSASSFHVPVYELYGKSISVTAGHTHEKIEELVKNKQADVGASIESLIEQQSGLRIIHRSRPIPSAGIFISPQLSKLDRHQIEQVFKQAPEEIRRKISYQENSPPNYDSIEQISRKTEEVMRCANFDKNPVQFFCRR